jgi:hypothetical protein
LPISLILGGKKGLAVGNLFRENSLAGVNVSQENRPAWKGLIRSPRTWKIAI